MSAAGLRPLNSLRITDAGEAGAKAATLGELLAAGFRVPEGVVLDADAASMTPADRRAQLRAAELGAGPFAVRSSGLAEDGSQQSYAGMYETVLDVEREDLGDAVERVLESAGAARVAAYEGPTEPRMAVIVQRMVDAVAAGVALTADPVSGDRGSCVVSAVRGTGERLVSGTASGDEWLVRGVAPTPRRQPEHAIDRDQARRVATEARRIATLRGGPQDVEWAIDVEGTLWILQARPMTALPPDVSWEPPAPGAYTRAVRFGEWIGEPVTPLFESWLLTVMEDRLHDRLKEWIGQRAPKPYHVVVNGWYFYSLNFLSPAALARSMPKVFWRLVRSPRRVVGLIPALLRHSVPVYEREWREELLPRYRSAVARAEAGVETADVSGLTALIDELAQLAGDYFGSIATLSGAAYKAEISLARFQRRHLPTLPGGHLPLLVGLAPPEQPGRHAVASLDWWHGTATSGDAGIGARRDHADLVATRQAAERTASRALEGSPRRLRRFRQMVADAQHLVLVREEQVRDLTLAWPAMRRAVMRIGEALVERGVLERADDVFFLTRTEALEALDRGVFPGGADVAQRRAMREQQAQLVPPLVVGRLNRVLRQMWDAFPRLLGAASSDRAIVSGAPAAPGRATGLVRVVRGAQDFDELRTGEVLVAPLTAPAWTPLFTRAAAVVTDVGSAASHASIIAREYGIPAVVGCGDATARLRTGMRVTVDGTTGNVEPDASELAGPSPRTPPM